MPPAKTTMPEILSHTYIKLPMAGKIGLPINANLPEHGSTFTIGEDHVNPDLLFVGTMFGVFVSNTPEIKWVKLSAGIPTTTVMDLDIQKEENDLVVSTFGRGVYILDDYSPLRYLSPEVMEEEAIIFPIEDGLMFVEADPFGFPGVGFQGAQFYTTPPNPEVGAVINFYIKEKPKIPEGTKAGSGERITKSK